MPAQKEKQHNGSLDLEVSECGDVSRQFWRQVRDLVQSSLRVDNNSGNLNSEENHLRDEPYHHADNKFFAEQCEVKQRRRRQGTSGRCESGIQERGARGGEAYFGLGRKQLSAHKGRKAQSGDKPREDEKEQKQKRLHINVDSGALEQMLECGQKGHPRATTIRFRIVCVNWTACRSIHGPRMAIDRKTLISLGT